MLVLQVGEIPMPPTVISTPQEVETIRGGYVSAIEQLDAEGLIDSGKVGIIGFSRTGWYVLNTLLPRQEVFCRSHASGVHLYQLWRIPNDADYVLRRLRRAKQIASALGPELLVQASEMISDTPGFNTDKIIYRFS